MGSGAIALVHSTPDQRQLQVADDGGNRTMLILYYVKKGHLIRR
jgi:hypothetical protein